LRSGSPGVVRPLGAKNGKESQGGKRSLSGSAEGEPERSESPREQKVPLRTNYPKSDEGYGFLDGMKSLKRTYEVHTVSCESAGVKRFRGNSDPIIREEQRSEGRTPGVLEVERNLPGAGELKPPRG
jgi:hypothetical protein